MTLSPRKKIFIGSFVVSLGVASYFAWTLHFGISKNLRSNPVLKKDYQILKGEDSKTRVEQISMALHRLNSYRLPEGLAEALKRERDPRPQVRSSVAESLAMNVMQGEVLEAEIRLLGDPEEAVRVAALTALSRVGDPRRVELLKKAMGNPSKSVREEFLIRSGLYNATQGSEQESHLSAIHALLDQHKGDPGLNAFGLKVLLRTAATDARSLDRVEGAFLNSATPKELIPSLYRQLVRTRPELLVKRFSKDARSAFVALRITALNSILELCPPERWDVIQGVVNDPEMDPQSKMVAKRIASHLGGKIDASEKILAPPAGSDRCAVSRRGKLKHPDTGKGT